jgi:hypothetical protein
MYRNIIDLHYVSANTCQDFLCKSLHDYIYDQLIGELGTIEGYINKYDNKWDRAEGVDVTPLIEARQAIWDKLALLKTLEKNT